MTEVLVDRPSRQTAGDQAETAMFDAIMAGTIPAGSPLRLQELAAQLGMSIMPVREALRRLEGRGLVEIVPHRGAWVRPLTLADLHDTYFTRLNLESLAVRAAAARFTEDDARAARAALAEHVTARAGGDVVRARSAHERFHYTLYEASGSQWLVRSIGPAWLNSERYRVESVEPRGYVKQWAGEHSGILDALVAHDADSAVELLAQHLRSAVDLVADGLRAEDDGDAALLPLPSTDELLGVRRPAPRRGARRS